MVVGELRSDTRRAVDVSRVLVDRLDELDERAREAQDGVAWLLRVDQAVLHGCCSVFCAMSAAAFCGDFALLTQDLVLPAQATELVALVHGQTPAFA